MMKTLQTFKWGLFAVGTLILTTPATQALADQPGPYYATPSWDQKLQCDTTATCPRFIVLSNWASAAVLDRETGLVWEKSPDQTRYIWYSANSLCINKDISGRKGWRLPSVQELVSLIDSTAFPTLPPGHPFVGVQTSSYWSVTSRPTEAGAGGWVASFSSGSAGAADKINSPNFVWCVRSGPGADVQ